MGQLPGLIKLFPKNTQLIQVEGLQDIATGQYLDAATITATLTNQRGYVDAILKDITLSYIPATNGNYQGTVPSTFDAPLGDGYTLEISASQSNVDSFFSIPVRVQLRSEQ